jgi:transposase
MRGKPRAKEEKAAAIAALILGDSPTVVAERYSLPRATVRNWQPEAKELAEVSRISGSRITDLVENYVESGLESLTAQAREAANPEWLMKQSAKDLAALHDGMTERTFSLLAMVSKRN